MKRIFKLLALASVILFVGARRNRRADAVAHTDPRADLGTSGMPQAPAAATESGISEVDPEGLMGFGEGIDPEAIRAAHAEPALLHDRLPQPGKNLP